MKKYHTAIYISVFTLLFNLVSFAQAPEDFEDPAELDPTDAAAVPIDDYLWVLALVGLIFVFIWFKNHAKQANAGLNEK
jgi:hypothetical protein